MKKISDKIIEWCKQNYQFAEDEYPVFEYGIQLILNTFLKVIMIFMIGFVIGYFQEVVVTLSVFCGIRHFAGGVHCKTDLGCFCVMLFICMCPIFMFRVDENFSKWIWGVISVYSVYEMIRYAPRNSKVNPIYDSKILVRKRIGSLIVTGIAVLLLFCYPELNMRWLIAMPLFIEAVTISPIFYGWEVR